MNRKVICTLSILMGICLLVGILSHCSVKDILKPGFNPSSYIVAIDYRTTVDTPKVVLKGESAEDLLTKIAQASLVNGVGVESPPTCFSRSQFYADMYVMPKWANLPIVEDCIKLFAARMDVIYCKTHNVLYICDFSLDHLMERENGIVVSNVVFDVNRPNELDAGK